MTLKAQKKTPLPEIINFSPPILLWLSLLFIVVFEVYLGYHVLTTGFSLTASLFYSFIFGFGLYVFGCRYACWARLTGSMLTINYLSPFNQPLKIDLRNYIEIRNQYIKYALFKKYILCTGEGKQMAVYINVYFADQQKLEEKIIKYAPL